MRKWCLVLFSLAIVGANAQQLPNENFTNPQIVPCIGDSSQQILGYHEWQAYQTVNDIWNGSVDTNICIYIGQNAGKATIDFSQVDTSRKVFIRSVMDSTSFVPLAPHSVYHLADLISLPTDMVLDTSGNCPNNLCSGAITIVEIPDSSGNGKTSREYRGSLMSDWVSSRNFKTCFASEKFNDQKVIEHVMSFKVIEHGTVDQLQVNSAGFINFGALPYPLDDSNIEQFRTSQYEYALGDPYNYIVTHQGSTYPSADSISYLELRVFPNVSTQETIDLTVYVGLLYELFTQFRGAYVDGDTIRHNLNLINWGEQCMPDWAELVFDGGDRLTYSGGMIEMGGPLSCLQFGSGGGLRISPGAEFHFGAPGRGILALRTGANLEIGNSAELIIHNKLYLQEYREETESQQVEMTLGPNSKLIFAPGACVDNSNSIDQNMKLVVYLDGGVADISALSPEDQDKIVLKRLPQENEETLQILGNPVVEHLQFALASRTNGVASIRVFDISGKQVLSKEIGISKGEDHYSLEVSHLSSGIYILQVEQEQKLGSARFLMQ